MRVAGASQLLVPTLTPEETFESQSIRKSCLLQNFLSLCTQALGHNIGETVIRLVIIFNGEVRNHLPSMHSIHKKVQTLILLLYTHRNTMTLCIFVVISRLYCSSFLLLWHGIEIIS